MERPEPDPPEEVHRLLGETLVEANQDQVEDHVEGAPEAVLRAAGVDPGARGETLDVDDFIAIAAARGAVA